MKTKSEALADFLEERGVRFHTSRAGWQKVSCYGSSHARGDRDPSASVNLTKGKYHCFVCDLSGDVIDLLQAEDSSLTYPDALATLGIANSPEGSKDTEVWL